MKRNRRKFLEDVGSGMLIGGLGTALAGDLGVTPAFANEGDDSLDFGELHSLVRLMQDTTPQKLQPILIQKLRDKEVSRKDLIGAAALANAETFGGQDYVGFHTEMALLPALQMSQELPADRQALPVLKVIYRNSQRIQDSGLAGKRRLKKVVAVDLPAGAEQGQLLLDASREADMMKAEQIFAATMNTSAEHAFNKVLWAIQDNANVHRFALAHRAWALIDVVGEQHAHTLLRQCIRFCVEQEKPIQGYFERRGLPTDPLRPLIPKLVDQYGLLSQSLGTRVADDAWLEEMSTFIYRNDAAESMDAVAAALKDGMHPESVGQAISLAANQLVLRQDRLGNDNWRAHGATPGVHASDAINAWRNITRMSSHRNAVVGLLVSAYHTGNSKAHSDYDPLPHSSDVEKIKTTGAAELLASAEDAIRQNDQRQAAAAVAIYGQQGHAARPVFELMLRYAISEDGRLHAEKYYRTVTEEFETANPAFKWRHLTSLARVTASAYGFTPNDEPGYRAAGYEDACRALNVEV